MSYDDYVNHMIQKYRLAISIAIIRSKPENITLEEYIQQLRTNISKEKSNSDSLSISLCSDDFHIDETDKDTNIDENTNVTNSCINEIVQSNKKTDKTDVNNEQIDKDCTKITGGTMSIDFSLDVDKNTDVIEIPDPVLDVTDEMFRQNEMDDVEMIDTQDLNESITILENFAKVNDTESEEKRNLDDVMAILRDIDVGMTNLDMVISSEITKSNENNQYSITDKHTSNIELNSIHTEQDDIHVENINMKKPLREYRHTKQFGNIYQNVANIFGNNHHICEEGKDNRYDKDILKDTRYCIEEVIDDTKEKRYDQDIKDISKDKKYVKDIVHNITDKTYDKDIFKDTRYCVEEIKDDTKEKRYQDVKDITDNIIHRTYDKDILKDTRYSVKEIKDDTKEKRYQDIKDTTKDKRDVKDITDNIINRTYDKDIIKDTRYSVKEIEDDTKEKRYHKDIKDISKDKTHIEKENRHLEDITHNTTNKTHEKDIEMNKTQDKFTYETYYSPSQTSMLVIDDIYIRGVNSNLKQNKIIKNSDINIEKDEINNVLLQEIQINNNSTEVNKINYREDEELLTNNEKIKFSFINEVVFSQDSELAKSPKNYLKNNNSNKIEKNQNRNDFSKEKLKKNKVKYIESDLFSQESKLTCFSIDNNQNLIENSLVFSQNAQNDEYFERTRSLQNFTKNYNEKDKDMSINKSSTEFDKTFNHRHEGELNERSTNIDVNSKNTQITNDSRTGQDILEIKQANKTCINFDKVLENSQAHILEDINDPVPEDCTNFDDNVENMEVEEESLVEFVPFKVIEELNKIKNYLNKKNNRKINFDENSSDTGYKSDSQSKNSLKMSQSSNSWLDQSAHSIFDYLIQRPLAAPTEDITNEISEVLGQLIDKLHEEESYPTFLEEYLDSVQTLLSFVYGKNTKENVVMEKDETIQRILLLNRSIHIQKYTIEKITQILENLHTELTKTDCSFEIENIDQVENICYIFHLLEILLQKYNKTCQNLSRNSQNLSQNSKNLSQNSKNLSQTSKNLSQNSKNLSQNSKNLSQNSQNLSQSTQNSQEECILKKSNITDIWRKKWNPNYRECETEGSSEKKCILTNCCTILNKIVVDCMNEYSLISYSALKCFNVMQK